MSQALTLIQSLGFSTYEAKAYVGLLACQPATAYELAKHTGIPTSKIYETIKKLTARRIFQPTQGKTTETQQYVALSPQDFSDQITEATVSKTRELLPLLEDAAKPGQEDFIWPLSSRAEVTAKAQELIRQASKSILISGWPEELALVEEDLLAADLKGISIALVHFGDADLNIGATYYHPVEKTLYAEKGGRGFTLVADESCVLIANHKVSGAIDAAWSRNEAFVTVAEDYVKHDVYITKVTRFLDPEMKARFGDQYEKLRDVFNAES